MRHSMLEVPEHLKGRSLTRINDWTHDDLRLLLDVADALKERRAAGETDRRLAGRTIGLLFEGRSTRARVSFAVAAAELGAQAVTLEAEHTHLAHGESPRDTALVLSRYLSALVYRARRQADLDELAAAATIPVLNDESEISAPCQALADLMTIRERLGRLSGVRLAYVGAGNNICRSLMRGAAKFGLRFIAATPPDHRPADEAVEQTRRAAIQHGGTVEFTDDPREAAERAEVVYTSASLDSDPETAEFVGFTVDEELLELAPDAFVMHSLPALPGREISDSVLHGPRAAVWDQAENRLHVQKALLALVVR
jgi:ornithine carbamoyltransferase